MAGTSLLDAILERLVEKTKRDKPDVDLYRKQKKEKPPSKKTKKSLEKKLH